MLGNVESTITALRSLSISISIKTQEKKMKLRIRSLETKETIRIEIADSSSLLDLKTLIAGKLSSSSSSSSSPSSTPISPQSVALSLNRKDELFSSSPTDSLQSLGLTSGDLLFCYQTLTPPPKIPNPETRNESISVLTQDMDVKSEKESPLMEKCLDETLTRGPNSEIPNSEVTGDSNKTLVDSRQEMEVDMETETPSMEKSPSVPCFLKRVMDFEKEDIKGNLGFLVVAVHAVFLESGFVVWNGDGSRLPKDWNLATTAVSVRYTIPDLLMGQIQERSVKFATLKFSVMRNHVSVYGSLSGEPDVYRLYLDLSKVVPLLVFLSDRVSGEEEKEVFKFWKTVKDGLCLPLLIDICEKNGLPPPPCFARLPTELKMKVFELLPGVDVARFGCSSSEMRYLASNDELWKQKFMEEFGQAYESEVALVTSWKDKFRHCWVKTRDADKTRSALLENRYGYQTTFLPRYPPFAPQRFPFVGGDYDRFPVIGDRGPMGPRLPARRKFSPHCNLGGHSGNFTG